jgi:hypothetical protein
MVRSSASFARRLTTSFRRRSPALMARAGGIYGRLASLQALDLPVLR